MFNNGSFSLIESRTLRGREGINLLVHACHSNSLSFFFPSFLIFSFFLSFFLSYSLFLFPSFQVFNTIVLPLVVVVVPVHDKGLFYSTCHDWILLFEPLTTFVWSGCTCRPPLVRLCATPYCQTKENYFVCLSAVTPFPATVWVPSLFLFLMACT